MRVWGRQVPYEKKTSWHYGFREKLKKPQNRKRKGKSVVYLCGELVLKPWEVRTPWGRTGTGTGNSKEVENSTEGRGKKQKALWVIGC